ncbi:VOC family protein [Ovoidimarina sediminis]|uniref:VOC family protein n=1 Tax=Ovoidimarina sediminis TaxID=3079856 RepID=UPI00291256CF|nr:VOC family protein [Rhodophyticola sp. MJ-SS7]MDU8946632.1 VOC family protein [Rhodophyticola sp. MJ-SS7]
MSILKMSAIGNPGWIGYSGPDQAKAQGFYRDVLGWSLEEMPMQDGSSYTVIKVGDTAVGGFSSMPEAAGAWTIFVTVPDVDAAVAAAESADGRVLQPAMDMPGVGRMATLSDPDGARFAVITYESMAS